MATIIIPGRAAGGLRLNGPVAANPGLVRALGIYAWFPFNNSLTSEIIYKRGVTYNGGTLEGNPLGGQRIRITSTTQGINIASILPQVTPQEGFVSIWVTKVANGAFELAFNLRYDGNNEIVLLDANGNFGVPFQFDYSAGGTRKRFETTSLTDNVLTHVAMSWSLARDQVKCYMNGILLNTATGLGTFAGTPVQGAICNGTNFNSGWIGTIHDCILGNRVPSDREIWDLYAPDTRNNIYWIPSSKLIFDVGAAPPATANPWYAFAQQ